MHMHMHLQLRLLFNLCCIIGTVLFCSLNAVQSQGRDTAGRRSVCCPWRRRHVCNNGEGKMHAPPTSCVLFFAFYFFRRAAAHAAAHLRSTAFPAMSSSRRPTRIWIRCLIYRRTTLFCLRALQHITKDYPMPILPAHFLDRAPRDGGAWWPRYCPNNNCKGYHAHIKPTWRPPHHTTLAVYTPILPTPHLLSTHIANSLSREACCSAHPPLLPWFQPAAPSRRHQRSNLVRVAWQLTRTRRGGLALQVPDAAVGPCASYMDVLGPAVARQVAQAQLSRRNPS